MTLATRLYRLQPADVGLASCESLLSYMMRLAEEHCTTTYGLFMRFIRPLAPINLEHGLSAHVTLLKSGLGLGNTARTLVDVLQRLTGRDDLARLTFLRYENVLDYHGLITGKLTIPWCPECVADQNEREVAYEPLLWAVAGVSICPTHRTEMLVRCTNSECKGNKLIAGLKVIGFCSSCGRWQGTRDGFEVGTYEHSFDQRLWYAQQLVALIALQDAPSGFEPLGLRASLEALQKKYGRSIGELYRAARIAKSVFSYWRTGRALPSFPRLASLCYAARVNIVDVLLGNVGAIEAAVPPPAARQSPFKGQAKRRSTDLHEIEAALRRSLENPQEAARAVDDLARVLNTEKSTIRTHFPDLARQLSERRSAWRKKWAFMKRKIIDCRIRNAVDAVRAEGLEPTQRRVEQRLGAAIPLVNKRNKNVYLACRYGR